MLARSSKILELQNANLRKLSAPKLFFFFKKKEENISFYFLRKKRKIFHFLF